VFFLSSGSWSNLFRWGRKRNSDSAESLCSAEMAVFDRIEKMSSGDEDDDESWVTFQVTKSPSDTSDEATGRAKSQRKYQFSFHCLMHDQIYLL